MRTVIFNLLALASLAACAASGPRDTQPPDSPPGARRIDSSYRDQKPDTDPALPRRTPASRAPNQPLYGPILTE